MKEIKDMNLAECINRLRELPDGTIEDQFDMRDLPWIFDVAEELANRIHELTRWIPVSERMPTEADGKHIHIFDGLGLPFTIMRKSLGSYVPTHWKRITPPEGV